VSEIYLAHVALFLLMVIVHASVADCDLANLAKRSLLRKGDVILYRRFYASVGIRVEKELLVNPASSSLIIALICIYLPGPFNKPPFSCNRPVVTTRRDLLSPERSPHSRCRSSSTADAGYGGNYECRRIRGGRIGRDQADITRDTCCCK
jgi:hypothetical protein